VASGLVVGVIFFAALAGRTDFLAALARTILGAADFFCFFAAAHRLRCASAIRFRPSGLSLRVPRFAAFRGVVAGVPRVDPELPVFDSSVRAC
jgi:hypothetical protein